MKILSVFLLLISINSYAKSRKWIYLVKAYSTESCEDALKNGKEVLANEDRLKEILIKRKMVLDSIDDIAFKNCKKQRYFTYDIYGHVDEDFNRDEVKDRLLYLDESELKDGKDYVEQKKHNRLEETKNKYLDIALEMYPELNEDDVEYITYKYIYYRTKNEVRGTRPKHMPYYYITPVIVLKK